MLDLKPLVLDETQEQRLLADVRAALDAALEAHAKREDLYVKWMRAYKARPDQARKDYPWPGASNVVVPLVAISVDAIAARLQKALLASKDFLEVEILSPAWEQMEDLVREWGQVYATTSGLKDRLRTVFFDTPLYGDAWVKMVWVEETREYHQYDAAGNVVTQEIPGFTGAKPFVIPPADVIVPQGYDDVDSLPWISHRLRYTWPELKKLEAQGHAKLDELKQHKKARTDPRYLDAQESATTNDSGAEIYELYEISGVFEVPNELSGEPAFEEVVLTYSMDAHLFTRAIYNPFFGRARNIVKIPFLVQAHELYSMGVAEQALPFQEEASTAHNQVIDAGTASNCGLIVHTNSANFGPQEEIYPGKRIQTDEPLKDITVLRLNEASTTLGSVEQKAAFLAEKRTGVSAYNLGQESSIVGSGATATGTTAILSEGNLRFWVSIDDMRRAVEELLYLAIQQEQQFRPDGYEFAPGKTIVFPKGDVRTSLGLKLTLTNEALNRELELQNMQLLMGVLNEYYGRLMQAGAMILNPQFPPQQKQIAIQVMTASQNIVRRFVERFAVENLDEVVPNLVVLLGQTGVGGPAGAGQAGAPQLAGGGMPQGAGPAPPGGFPGESVPMPGGSTLPS